MLREAGVMISYLETEGRVRQASLYENKKGSLHEKNNQQRHFKEGSLSGVMTHPLGEDIATLCERWLRVHFSGSSLEKVSIG